MLNMHFPTINIYSLIYSWISLSRNSRGPLQNFDLSEIRLKGSEGLSEVGNFIYLLTASHNIHRLAWGPMLAELQKSPVCPRVKTALLVDVWFFCSSRTLISDIHWPHKTLHVEVYAANRMQVNFIISSKTLFDRSFNLGHLINRTVLNWHNQIASLKTDKFQY